MEKKEEAVKCGGMAKASDGGWIHFIIALSLATPHISLCSYRNPCLHLHISNYRNCSFFPSATLPLCICFFRSLPIPINFYFILFDLICCFLVLFFCISIYDYGWVFSVLLWRNIIPVLLLLLNVCIYGCIAIAYSHLRFWFGKKVNSKNR